MSRIKYIWNVMKLNPLSSRLTRERIFIMDLNKLKADLSAKKTGNKTEFNDLIVVYTGVAETQYFAKLKDENGNVVKGSDGKAKKVDTVSGYTYTFNELGTAKMVKVVLNKENLNVQLLNVYKIGGLGYDLRQSNMIFIDEKGTIRNYA